VEVLEQHRRHVLAGDPARRDQRESLVEQAVVQHGVELGVGRHRLREHGARPAAQRPVRLPHRRGLGGRVHAPRHRVTGVAPVEAGEGVGAVADDGHRLGLEDLEGGRDVEDRLHARADDEHRCGGEGGEVGGHVPALPRAAVHATQPAGREHLHACGVREGGGGGHGGGAVPAQAHRGAQVAHRQLREPARAHAVQLARREADAGDPVEDRHGGGDGSVGADGGLEVLRGGAVLRRRKAVGEQRALQRDHGAACGNGIGDLG
jgi:hypothetical protein